MDVSGLLQADGERDRRLRLAREPGFEADLLAARDDFLFVADRHVDDVVAGLGGGEQRGRRLGLLHLACLHQEPGRRGGRLCDVELALLRFFLAHEELARVVHVRRYRHLQVRARIDLDASDDVHLQAKAHDALRRVVGGDRDLLLHHPAVVLGVQAWAVTFPTFPGGIASSNEATVHPQPGLAERIFRTSVPVFRISKTAFAAVPRTTSPTSTVGMSTVMRPPAEVFGPPSPRTSAGAGRLGLRGRGRARGGGREGQDQGRCQQGEGAPCHRLSKVSPVPVRGLLRGP